MMRIFRYLLPALAVLLAACSGGASPAGSPTAPGVTPAPVGQSTPALPVDAASPGPSITAVTPPTPLSTQGATPSSVAPAGPSPSASAIPQPAARQANSLPDPTGYHWQDIASGLQDAVGLAVSHDGTGRLFVVIREGLIRIIQDGHILDAPFLDISNKVLSAGTEQGFLGLAFHPDYKQNGYFYVNYIDLDGNTVIARFHVSQDANQADPASEKDLLRIQQPFPNHNGGSVVFGPDGYLYLGMGDGGSQGDPQLNGQSVQTLLGKILRIDVDHGDPYSIPASNPFARGGGKPEIWAYGLRNPWRFSFDAKTNDLYIADVGQDLWEEIDFLPAGSSGGENFGWSYREGLHPYKGTPPAGLKLVDPVFEYSHAEGGCSVTGGYVYRGRSLPAWQGVYLFADYCSGLIWGLVRHADGAWEGKLLFQTDYHITSFGQDDQGEIYLVDQGGRIARLEANP